MQLGIFAKTFSRPTVEETFDAVLRHDLDCIQFNMACAGLASMPEEIPPQIVARIRAALDARHMTMAAVSGTFNMAHPDPKVRQAGLHRLSVLLGVCKDIGTSIVTLCTGSRDPEDMWHWHDDNRSPEAWRDMLATIETAVKRAEEAQVMLAFEPERANIVYSARQGRELLTAIASPYLKVVLDPANLIDGTHPAAIADVIDEAFDLLGDQVVIAHAKDRGPNDSFQVAGQGVLNYQRYLKHLTDANFTGALIIHGLPEAEVDRSVRFLRSALSNPLTTQM